MKKLKKIDSSYFRSKSHFEKDDTSIFFVFQPMHRYFKTFSANDSNILSWKCRGLSDQSIKAPNTDNKTLNSSLDYICSKLRVKFNGDCLKQGRLTFKHGKIVTLTLFMK